MAAGLYLLVILVGGVAVNFMVRPVALPPGSMGTARLHDRFDLLALMLVIAALGLRLWKLGTTPVSGDEVSNIEMEFWSNWFLNYESGSHPPLFRFLIHLTETHPESLWIIRGPAAAFGALGVGLLYLVARHRGSGPMALAIASLLAVFPPHLIFSGQQKSYTLLICLLLAAHLALQRALDGSRRQWGFYSLWALLASLTHFLAPFVLLAHLVFVAGTARPSLGRVAIALGPAYLATAPFLVLQLTGHAGDRTLVPSLGLAANLWHGLHDVAYRLLVLFSGALLLVGRRPAGREWTLETWTLLFGLAGLGIVAWNTPLQARYLLFLVPFLLLWVAAWSRDSRRPRAQIAIALTGFLLFCGLSFHRLSESQEAHQGILAQRAIQAHRGTALPEGGAVLVTPGSMLEVVSFVKRPRRDFWHFSCPGFYRAYRHEGKVLFHLDARGLDAALQRLGGFTLYRFRFRAEPEPRELATWVKDHCRRVDSLDPDGPTAVYSCGAGSGTGGDVCEALAGLDNRG